MTQRKVLQPHELLLTGEWFQRLRDLTVLSSINWVDVELCFRYFLPLKDVQHLEFIGEETQDLLDKFGKTYSSQGSKSLDSFDRDTLRSSLERWEGRLKEISREWILSYPDSHIDVSKLLQGPKAFLSNEEFSMLEPLEIHGLSEAASSLLFNNFTSAEFMALRTSESLLKKWYEKKIGKKLGRTTWGQVLEKLNEEYPNEKERPKELLLLDYLRERRNEIAHPEAVSNSIQASTTFLNVISLCQALYFKPD